MGANPTTVLKTTTTKETSTTTIQDCDCGSEREYCNACADLRDNSSEFYTNGVTENVCNSLSNDKGFNPESEHDDCDDLHLANDCLIETLIEKLPAYDVCDWKDFMGDYMPNQYNMNEAIICALCGMWCRLGKLLNPTHISFDEKDFIAGEGVAFDRTGAGSIKITMDIIGNVAVMTGSITFEGSKWLQQGPVDTNDGNWLVWELRIKKSKYHIKHIYAVDSQTVNMGGYLATAYGFDGDQDFSKYGRGHRGIYSNRTPKQWGWEYGYNTVPEGYIYVQLRVSEIISPFEPVTFIANMPVILDVEAECQGG